MESYYIVASSKRDIEAKPRMSQGFSGLILYYHSVIALGEFPCSYAGYESTMPWVFEVVGKKERRVYAVLLKINYYR